MFCFRLWGDKEENVTHSHPPRWRPLALQIHPLRSASEDDHSVKTWWMLPATTLCLFCLFFLCGLTSKLSHFVNFFASPQRETNCSPPSSTCTSTSVPCCQRTLHLRLVSCSLRLRTTSLMLEKVFVSLNGLTSMEKFERLFWHRVER